MNVSLIMTVLNEELSITECLKSIARQTRRPDEVVIVDGGSTDATLHKLRAWRRERPDWNIRVEAIPGVSISKGRNAAISIADGEIIAVTDAGTILHEDWLLQIADPIERGSADVAGGFFVPAGRGMARLIADVTLPRIDEIDARRFLPSSRSVAFLKAHWSTVAGYPEWIDYCEDLIFDLALKQNGSHFVFVPGAVVNWEGRPSLLRFFKQYYRYARGDGDANLWPMRHLMRYATYAAITCAFSLKKSTIARVATISIYASLHHLKYLRRSLGRTQPRRTDVMMKRAALTPVVVMVGDAAKMAGYPAGVLRRVRRSHP